MLCYCTALVAYSITYYVVKLTMLLCKGDYENLCKFVNTDWEPYLRQCSSTDTKGLLFKNRLAEGIEKFVPKISNFYEWRKPSWKCPLSRDVREKMRYKHMEPIY